MTHENKIAFTDHVLKSLERLEGMGIKPGGFIAITGNPELNKELQPELDAIYSHIKEVEKINDPGESV